jgi:hypothetical protein
MPSAKTPTFELITALDMTYNSFAEFDKALGLFAMRLDDVL